MEFGRAARGVALASALGLAGCGGSPPVSSVEHNPSPMVIETPQPDIALQPANAPVAATAPPTASAPRATTTAPSATVCEKWEVANPAARAELEAALTAVAKEYTPAANGESNTSTITPGMSVVVGCGKTVLATLGVGNTMYPQQAGKVVNSLTHKKVPRAEVSADNTEYDVASITKLVTTVGILMMQQQGLLNIDTPVSKYVPEWKQGAKATVTMKMLLEHHSGLVDPPYARIIKDSHNPDQIWHQLLTVPLTNPPGTPYASEANYSNIGFNVAYIAATNAAGISPASFLTDNLFKPLGMSHTGYAPDARNCAPTSPDRNQAITLDCVPQDDLSRALSMRAGNASLFTSAADLGKFESMLSMDGAVDGHQYLTPASMALLKTPTNPAKTYGLGDRMNGHGLFGTTFSEQSFGHTGWNGGAAVVDPKTHLFFGELMNGTDLKPAPSSPSYKMVGRMTAAISKVTATLK